MRLSRRRLPVRIALAAPSVAAAVAAVRQHQEQGPRARLRVRVTDEGSVRARVPGGRHHTPPYLKGRFSADAGGVALQGAIRESRAEVLYARTFSVLAMIMAGVAAALAIVGSPAPGSYVCGTAAVVFGSAGYGLARFRARLFDIDCGELLTAVKALLPPERPG